MYQYIVPQSMKRFWFDCFDFLFIYFFIDIDILLICLDRKFRSHGHVLKSDNTNSTDYDLQLSTMRHLQALVSFANYK